MSVSRREFLIAGGLTGLGALAGCGGLLEEPDVTAEGFGEDASGTINVWCRGGNMQDGIQAMIDEFHRVQDRVHVSLTPVPDSQYVTKLATAIRGGRPPDLVDIDCINSALFIHRDAFTDLTPLVEELPYKDQLSPGHFDLAMMDGRYYGVPFLGDFSVLWCNLELFDRAGVDIDEATTSFEGYLEAARAISELDEEIWGWQYAGNASGALGFTVQPHIWATGTDLISGEVGDQVGNILENEPLQRTLEMLRTMWDEDLVPPGSHADDASLWYADYAAGRIGMIPNSYGNIVSNSSEELLENTESRLLSGPDGDEAFFTGGDNFALPNGGPNPSAAWEFAKFCLEVEQQTELPSRGYTPIRADVMSDEFRERFPHAVAPLENLDAGYAPLTLAYNRLYNQPDGPWLEMFRRAVFEGQVDDALHEAQPQFDLILAQGEA